MPTLLSLGQPTEGNDVYLYLNVTETATAVNTEGFMEPEPPPPPPYPYFVKMEMDGIPALNRPVNLRVTIASKVDVRNATFKIFLPEGFELVSGDLVWSGNLQRATSEEIGELTGPVDKFPEKALARIPENKKVRVRATIKGTLIGDGRIVVFPSEELELGVDCDLTGVYISRPGGAISYGGCLNVRVINETDGIFSEQKLPFEPRPQKRRQQPPETPYYTPPPGATPPPPP